MSMITILVIDDNKEVPTYDFTDVTYARTVAAGIEQLDKHGPWDEIWLDHDMGTLPGTLTVSEIWPVVDWLVNREIAAEEPTDWPRTIRVISYNPVGAMRMRMALEPYFGHLYRGIPDIDGDAT